MKTKLLHSPKEKTSDKIVYGFDIDGTICTDTNGKYHNAVAFPERIAKVNKLFDQGHTIIYYSGRGTNTHINWHALTTQQFRQWGVKHHQIMFGKQNFDLLIDNKVQNADDFFNDKKINKEKLIDVELPMNTNEISTNVQFLRHVAFPTNNLDKALYFYINLLEFKFFSEGELAPELYASYFGVNVKPSRLKWVKLSIPGGGIFEIISLDRKMTTYKTKHHIALTVKDLYAMKEKLTKENIKFLNKINQDQTAKYLIAFCYDYDNNLIEFVQSLWNSNYET